ncbi:hypothetical protein T10_11563 [Trichinella papuae]|uniref:Uncharacterized protein n=1 Tax=Trichinella papuae TaxID=268474 RepID=A0A0V1N5D9_9BILA|nr:hypothetical protein T10_11563 [Trichinella papuae]
MSCLHIQGTYYRHDLVQYSSDMAGDWLLLVDQEGLLLPKQCCMIELNWASVLLFTEQHDFYITIGVIWSDRSGGSHLQFG